MTPVHISVMTAEVLELLDPQPGEVVLDMTVGVGGHALALAERVGATGRVIGLDRDAGMLRVAGERLAGFPVTLVQANFEDFSEVLQNLQIPAVDAIVADLGFCSDQLADPQRGLSFQVEGPLDMRLDPSRGEPASALVQRLHEKDLADIFWQFGEERYSRRVARKIVEQRKAEPITTTAQLAELVRACVPRPRGQRHPIDPATRVFQALRIAVNDELGALERMLKALPDGLKPGGRVAILSFHSLEDRQVKHSLRDRDLYEPLTKKPRLASDDEVRHNPRSRSAKLRAARRR